MTKRVRETSAACFKDLEPSLSHREQIVLDALRHWGDTPPTSYELTQTLIRQHLAFDVNSTRPRISALVDRGLVEPGEKRKCSITGKKVYTWRLVRAGRASEPIAQRLQF